LLRALASLREPKPQTSNIKPSPMNVEDSYNAWSQQYDTNENKTRDLEAKALRETLAPISFRNCLEIGCGTGKNTTWLATKAKSITAVDLSKEMLEKAKQKITSNNVEFLQADINDDWQFAKGPYDLVSFSLVLEHMENLEPVFSKVSEILAPGGWVYIGELHPFKQYTGSKARFETTAGVKIVDCYNHHITDFINAAAQHGIHVSRISEYFDNDDRTTIPRVLTLVLKKA
jgi:2-polyprenyl-3-methyl-5-hydroxy-6-metoxy-1,4-benzoquinol methylase